MPLYKSLILLILLLLSSSSILAFKYAFFLFLKCLLASRLTLFRLSTLPWNLGAWNSWNPQGLSRPVMGLLCLLPFTTVFSIYPTAVTPTTRTTLYSETSKNSSITWCRNPKNILNSCWKVQIREDAYLHTTRPYCRTVTWPLKRLWSYNVSSTEVN